MAIPPSEKELSRGNTKVKCRFCPKTFDKMRVHKSGQVTSGMQALVQHVRDDHRRQFAAWNSHLWSWMRKVRLAEELTEEVEHPTDDDVTL